MGICLSSEEIESGLLFEANQKANINEKRIQQIENELKELKSKDIGKRIIASSQNENWCGIALTCPTCGCCWMMLHGDDLNCCPKCKQLVKC